MATEFAPTRPWSTHAAAARLTIVDGVRERDALAARRDADVAALRRRLREQADEFAGMLSETLRRLGDKLDRGVGAGDAPGAAGGADATVSAALRVMTAVEQVT